LDDSSFAVSRAFSQTTAIVVDHFAPGFLPILFFNPLKRRTTMSLFKRYLLTILAAALIVGFIACEKEGPIEKAGKKADNTIEKATDAVKEKTE
jgi:hypothetical protein